MNSLAKVSSNSIQYVDYFQGELPYEKDGGARWKFWKEQLRSLDVPRSCFVGVAWNFFHPYIKFVTILKQHIISSRFFFRLNAPKGIVKTPAVDL